MPNRYEQRRAERQRAARAVTPRPADAQHGDRRDERSVYEDRTRGREPGAMQRPERPLGSAAQRSLEMEFG
jgi:hypothetical protein